MPFETTLDLDPEDAKALLDTSAQKAKFYDLILDDSNGQKRVIKYVYLLERLSGDNPHVAKVRVADRRWLLPYFQFLGRFNMRRNVGYKRVQNNPSTPSLVSLIVPTIWYWPWSLRNGQPWKASNIVDEFMKQLKDFESGLGHTLPGYKIQSEVQNQDDRLSPDNLNLDDSGEAALGRMLAMYPNCGLYVDNDGVYQFFDRNTGVEGVAVEKMGPIHIGSGQFKKIDRSLTRPEKIEVFFTIEAEVRHDFIGNLSTVTADTRWLENVLPVPDFEVEVGGVKYPQSSWVSVQQIIRCPAWSNAPGIGGPLSSELIEKAALPYLDLWGALLLTGVREPDADWAARVAALQSHVRRTFQLSPTWMARTLSIKARRVSVLDPSTGTWAPSEAFCDHSYMGTVRSYFKTIQGGGNDLAFAINVEGYPAGGAVPGKSTPGGAQKFTSDSKPSPAMVTVLDGDQGIIHLNFMSDPNHIHEAALPGLVAKADNTLYPPKADWKDPGGQSSIGFDMVTDRAQVPKLKNNWKCCVILTHTPAAPNNKGQLYKITVKPHEIKDRLGKAGSQMDKCNGPTWQVRVGAGMDGAKALVRWEDDRAEDIEKLFGIGLVDEADAPNLSGLVTNHDSAGPTGYAISLTQIAYAIAAQIYSRFIDTYEGQGESYITPDIQMGGMLEQVTHKVLSDGQITTHASMRPQPMEVNLLSLLDSSTRAILLKLPHVERQ